MQKMRLQIQLVGDRVVPHPSVRIRAGPRGLSLPGHSSSAKKGALVSWERELQPSPDAEALPRDSVMSPDWRKCTVRAGKAGPGSLSAACTAVGWEPKSLCPSLRPEPHVVFIYNKLVKNESREKTWKTAS